MVLKSCCPTRWNCTIGADPAIVITVRIRFLSSMLVVAQMPTKPFVAEKTGAATALLGSSMAIDVTLKPPKPSTPLVRSERTALPEARRARSRGSRGRRLDCWRECG